MDKITRPWICFFSRSGREICDLSERLGPTPDIIVTNERPSTVRSIDPRIYETNRLVTLSNKPSTYEYYDVLKYYKNPIVTLHGWLRVVPEEVCNAVEIFNGHPGLITSKENGGYGDFLKGKDPIEKALNTGLHKTGCVIHKVTPGIDEGEILLYKEFTIYDKQYPEIDKLARETMIDLWENLLQKRLFC